MSSTVATIMKIINHPKQENDYICSQIQQKSIFYREGEGKKKKESNHMKEDSYYQI